MCNAQKHNFQINESTFNDIIIILNELMSFINKKYNMNFTYDGFEDD